MPAGQRLDDPQRLDALQRASILDSPVEESFDRATRLASHVLGTPVALVSVVDHDRQFFKSQVGLPEPWATDRETPLSHSFCQHVVMRGETLDVTDAREHDLVRDNLAIEDIDVVAYLGVPLTDDGGNVLGSFCVIDSEPREWTPEQHERLADIAAQVQTLLSLRLVAQDLEQASRERADLMAVITHDLRAPLANIRAASDMLDGLDPAEQEPFLGVIDRASERLGALVDGLAATERAGLPSRIREVDVVTVVGSVIDRLVQRHRIELSCPTVAPLVSDAAAVGQIVNNLVDLGLRRAPSGTRVRIDVQDSGAGVRLELRDAGELPPDLLARMFDPIGAGRSDGASLASHIVRRLVDAIGGKISADGGPDDGTVVTVELPDLDERRWVDGA